MGERPKRVSGRELLRVLKSFSWYVDRIRGSHHIMRSREKRGIVVSVAVHAGKTVPIGTVMDILKDTGISVEDFNREA